MIDTCSPGSYRFFQQNNCDKYMYIFLYQVVVGYKRVVLKGYSLSCGEISVDIRLMLIEGANVDELKTSQVLAPSINNEA